MATAQRFEDLKVWSKARELTREICVDADRPPFSKSLRFSDQITAASISIMSNIAEGFERGSRKDFLQFLHVAKGSAGEVRSQLYVASDRRFMNQARFDELYARVLEVSRMLSGLIGYLKKTPQKGPRYHPNYES